VLEVICKQFPRRSRSKSPSPTLATDIIQFGKVAKVDGVLKSSSNRFIMRLNDLGEAPAVSLTPSALETEDLSLSILPKVPKRDFAPRRTPPPRRPASKQLPQAKSATKLELQLESQQMDDSSDKLQPMRTRVQQQIYFSILAKPRNLTPINRQIKKGKRIQRMPTSPLIHKSIWHKSRLRQLRSVYDTVVS
jgi:hypothetical protein